MHVLWFTGVQLPAVSGTGLNRAGWQEGLRQALYQENPDLKLSIASFGSESYQPFEVENATYYNILREQLPVNRWKRMQESWKHRTFRSVDLSRILAVYQEVQPDMVFIFGTENPFGLLSDHFPVPTVISIQAVISGLVDNLFNGLTKNLMIQEFFSRETIIGQGIFHKWWTQKKHTRIEKEIYRKNNYFCGRTEWDHEWMKCLNSGARYFHIDRVLRDVFYHAEWDIGSSFEHRIFSLCGNAPFKGGITLVRALAYLIQDGNDQIKLRLAGVDSNSKIGKFICEMMKKFDLEDQVDLLGRLNSQQIIAEMQAARIFVLPTHMDNSPNSLAEAMILGMPCIASNAGGIPSMINDGVDGLLYPHTESVTLAEKIKTLISDPSSAQSLGRNARKIALERHNPSRIAKETMAVYDEVLNSEGDR